MNADKWRNDYCKAKTEVSWNAETAPVPLHPSPVTLELTWV